MLDWAKKFGGRTFVLAAAANFAHSLALHSYLHLPGFLQDLGADEFGIGNIMAVAFFTAIFVRPSLGRMMDSWGRRPVAIIGSVLNIITGIGYLFIDSLGAELIALRVVHGVAIGALFSVLFTIAADVVPAERRAQGIALFGISGMLPLALGGLMGDRLLADGDYGPLFQAITVCAGVGMLLCLPLAETRRVTSAPSSSFWTVISAPNLRSLWFVGLAFAFALTAFFIFLKTWVLELGEGSLGEVFSWYAGTAIFLRLFLGHVPERYGYTRVLYPALVLTTLGLGSLAFADSAFDLNVAGVLCGAGHGYAFPIISALVVQRARPENRGSAVAMFTALFDLGALIGGPSLGYIARGPGYPAMFMTASLTCLVATALFAVIERRGSHCASDE